MNKNAFGIVIVVLVIACAVEGYYVVKERNAKIALGAQLVAEQQKVMTAKPTGTPAPRPQPISKGQKFSDSPLFSKAYLIFPVTGTLSSDAQKALNGWDVKTTVNKDGSTQVDLIPKETGYFRQSFTVQKGFKLYFLEMASPDDQTAGSDKNRGDDVGILVDQSGLVQ